MDETYIRVNSKWAYLYRAIDSTGATIDFCYRLTVHDAHSYRIQQPGGNHSARIRYATRREIDQRLRIAGEVAQLPYGQSGAGVRAAPS